MKVCEKSHLNNAISIANYWEQVLKSEVDIKIEITIRKSY